MKSSTIKAKSSKNVPHKFPEDSTYSELGSSISDKHKNERVISSPNKTREDGMDDYRLEQRFPDEPHLDTADEFVSSTVEDQLRKLEYIKEETAESHSSDNERGRKHRRLQSKIKVVEQTDNVYVQVQSYLI